MKAQESYTQKIQRYGWVAYVLLAVVLVYTRFVGLGWGLPYPFHPDERNIADAISSITCHDSHALPTCANPHFFAYGQLTIYLGYILALFSRLATHTTGAITFVEAAMALRVISAIAALLTVWVGLAIVKLFTQSRRTLVSAALMLVFSPAAIQFAHYGTTESVLMLLYTYLVYFSVRYIKREISLGLYVGAAGFMVGLASGAKISSLSFALLPLVLIVFPQVISHKDRSVKAYLRRVGGRALSLVMFGIATAITTILTSPYSFYDLPDALSSLRYESDVALGRADVFYTRTFTHTIPWIFQFTHIYPYTLGIFMTAFFLVAFCLLPNRREYHILRLAFLMYAVPASMAYTKWSRFMAPVYPLMIIMVVLMLPRIYGIIHMVLGRDKRIPMMDVIMEYAIMGIIMLFLVLPGVSYLAIYTTPDVRFRASDWIYRHVNPRAYILEETANVIDIPIHNPASPPPPPTDYNYVSFDFYHLDENPDLATELQQHLDHADYIFIPSRRIFANHTCVDQTPAVCNQLRAKYRLLNNYYDALFTGKLGFRQVAEFTSYPRIELWGRTYVDFPDEGAEETWTVFDHPVVRIYKRG